MKRTIVAQLGAVETAALALPCAVGNVDGADAKAEVLGLAVEVLPKGLVEFLEGICQEYMSSE